jgi:hypothetical protein
LKLNFNLAPYAYDMIILILVLLIFIEHLFSLSPAQLLSKFAVHFQEICIDFVPNVSANYLLAESSLCGTALRDQSWQSVLIETGLIHVAVVSGAHFLLIKNAMQWLLAKLKCQNLQIWIQWPALTLYLLLSGFQPPAVRSFIQLLFAEIIFCPPRLHSRAISMGNSWLILGSGLFCLVLVPSWINSYSLYLSWIASLVLAGQHKNTGLIAVGFYLWLALIFPLSAFQSSHPLQFFISASLSGLIGAFTLGASSLLIIPKSEILLDPLFSVLKFLLHAISAEIKFEKFEFTSLSLLHWTYLLALQAAFHFQQIKNRDNAE